MTRQATRTDTPAGTKERDAHAGAPAGSPGPARITGGRARLRVAGLPLDLEHDVSRDVRARRPNIVNALIQARALERAARILSLLAIDFVAILGAICTALALKAIVRGDFVPREIFHTALDYQTFVFLVTALLFARSGLYSRREARPGLAAIVAGLFEAAFVSLVYALVNGLDFSSYYIFYGGLFFALIWVSALRWLYEHVTALGLRALGRRRRTILVGSGKQIDAVARGARVRFRLHALRAGRVHLAHAQARQRPAQPRLVAGAAAPDHRAPRARGDHRRPGLPAGRGVRARRPVSRARGRGPDRAHHDGDPDPQARAGARSDRAAVRAQAARLRGRRLRDQADLRLRGGDRAADRAVARAARDRGRDQAHLARPGAVPQPPRRASAASRSTASSSARCTRTPSSARRSSRR